MSIRQDLYHYKQNKARQSELSERIAVLRARAEKITPTYSSDKGGYSYDVKSKVEENAVKIVELENELKITTDRVNTASNFLDSLKPYRFHIVWACIVEHIPYRIVARQEKTSVQNVAKIIGKTLKEKPQA